MALWRHVKCEDVCIERSGKIELKSRKWTTIVKQDLRKAFYMILADTM